MGRGKAWSAEDSMLIAKSIVHVSHDPISGTGQKKATYYKRVYDTFVALQSTEDSSSIPVPHVNKFVGCYSKATSLVRSGWQDEDYVKLALEMFRHEKETEFELLDVWNNLRKSVPKFEDILVDGGSMPSITKENSDRKRRSTDPNMEDTVVPSAKLPRGVKREIEERDHGTDVATFRSNMIKAQNKRNALLEETNKMALMGRDDDDIAREYFMLKREMALESLKKRIEQQNMDDEEKVV
ncbi:hypothetical protein AC1031_010729 [Aphanomyces cochlioides]|nr:hypothetical protein AC1031_010729 [Aphanomyces cochlioides]